MRDDCEENVNGEWRIDLTFILGSQENQRAYQPVLCSHLLGPPRSASTWPAEAQTAHVFKIARIVREIAL